MMWDELLLATDSNLVMGCVWGVISAFLFSARNLILKYRFHHVPSDTAMLHQVIVIALTLSLKKLPAKSVAIISCAQPVIGALVAWLVIAEQPGWAVIAGGSIVLSVVIYEILQKSRQQLHKLNPQ